MNGREELQMRCADLGENRECLVLIRGRDRAAFLTRLRTHLRDAHGVTPAGFERRRRTAEARLDDDPAPTKE
jgi:predicted small metal-binding protein